MSWKFIKNYINTILLNFMLIFSKKKRKTAVLTDVKSVTTEPVAPPPIEVERPAVCVGTLRDITSMLDHEAVELYGRSPFVK